METNRRTFLQVFGTGWVVAACGDSGGGGALKATDLKVGDLKFLSNVSAIVGRDSGGLYAMSSICKHQSCDIASGGKILPGPPAIIQCGCHASQYDANGAVKSPPSTTNLDHIELSVAKDGTISVNTATVVPAATRVMA